MYDRDDDLPPSYPFEKALDEILNLEYEEYWSYIFERSNLLNQIGHRAIGGFLDWMAGERDGYYGSIGAAIYSVATSPNLTGADVSSEPTYHDSVGQVIAGKVVSRLVDYDDPCQAMGLALGSVSVMDEAAPKLSDLVEQGAKSLIATRQPDDPSWLDVYRVKSGAAIMRTLHITAQSELLPSEDWMKP